MEALSYRAQNLAIRNAAIERGDKIYYTIQPRTSCGHTGPFRVPQGQCVQCVAEYQDRLRKANLEKYAKNQRDNYQKNKDRMKRYNREYQRTYRNRVTTLLED